MNITLTGKKISQDERILAFKKDNLTAQMTFTVDTDDSWVYKLDVRLPEKCCTGEELFNIIDLPMDASRTCTIDVTAAMVPFTGKYTMQLRGVNPGALIPQMGLNTLFGNEKSVTIAIPMAVIMALIVWFVLNKTKFGYELKATGYNYHAARYCGMKENRNIIVTMMLSGALAGMGAALLYLTGIEEWETTISSVPAMGFNGIAVAFLGGLSPIGSILAAYFIQHITMGGGNVDLSVYCAQISSLISSLIIFLCAFVAFFKLAIQNHLRRREEACAAKAVKGGEDA